MLAIMIIYNTTFYTKILNQGCGSDQFQCDNLKCVPANYSCDGDNDCGDLSDETCGKCNSASKM